MSRSFGPQMTSTSWSNSVEDSPGQLGEIFDRPELRAAVGPAGIQGDHAPIAVQAEPLEDRVGRSLVGFDRGKLQPGRFLAAADGPGKLQVRFNHRRRHDVSARAAGIEFPGQQRAAAVADVADALLGPAPPCQPCGAKRIGHQHGHVELLRPHSPRHGRSRAAQRSFDAGIEKPLFVEPRSAGQHVGQVGAHDSHHAGFGPEMPPHRPQRRRGHRHVAQPVRKKTAIFMGDSSLRQHAFQPRLQGLLTGLELQLDSDAPERSVADLLGVQFD